MSLAGRRQTIKLSQIQAAITENCFETPNNTRGNVTFIITVSLWLGVVIIGVLSHGLATSNPDIMFFCNDLTLQFPYRSSTVTDMHLMALTTIFPIVGIALVEFGHQKRFQLVDRRYIGSVRIPIGVWSAAANVGIYCFNWAILALLTNCVKTVIGRPRPYFLSVCQPKLDMCKNGTMPVYKRDACAPERRPERRPELNEAALSFYSGHAAYTAFTAIWMVLFLETRLHGNGLYRQARIFMDVLVIVSAIGVALSRIFDYKHHGVDVLTGSIVGIVLATFSFYITTDHAFSPRGLAADPELHAMMEEGSYIYREKEQSRRRMESITHVGTVGFVSNTRAVQMVSPQESVPVVEAPVTEIPAAQLPVAEAPVAEIPADMIPATDGIFETKSSISFA